MPVPACVNRPNDCLCDRCSPGLMAGSAEMARRRLGPPEDHAPMCMCSDECLGWALLALRQGAAVAEEHRALVRRGRKLDSAAANGTGGATDVRAVDFGVVLDGVAGRTQVTDEGE